MLEKSQLNHSDKETFSRRINIFRATKMADRSSLLVNTRSLRNQLNGNLLSLSDTYLRLDHSLIGVLTSSLVKPKGNHLFPGRVHLSKPDKTPQKTDSPDEQAITPTVETKKAPLYYA